MGTETMRLSMMKLISSIDKRKVPDGDGNYAIVNDEINIFYR